MQLFSVVLSRRISYTLRYSQRNCVIRYYANESFTFLFHGKLDIPITWLDFYNLKTNQVIIQLLELS